MTQKREDHAPTVSNAIHDQAEKHDAQGEREEAGALNGANLRLRQVELVGPHPNQEASDDKTK